jgi:hypothetical protein
MDIRLEESRRIEKNVKPVRIVSVAAGIQIVNFPNRIRQRYYFSQLAL